MWASVCSSAIRKAECMRKGKGSDLHSRIVHHDGRACDAGNHVELFGLQLRLEDGPLPNIHPDGAVLPLIRLSLRSLVLGNRLSHLVPFPLSVPRDCLHEASPKCPTGSPLIQVADGIALCISHSSIV